MRYSNFALVMLLVLLLLSAPAAAERWVCPDSTTRLEDGNMVKIPILFGDQPAIDSLGFDLFYFDLRLIFDGLERSQLTQDWVVFKGGLFMAGHLMVTGWHTEPIPAAVTDTLCYVRFTVRSETKWQLSTYNFTGDLEGTEGCPVYVIGNEQSTWGFIKSIIRK